MNLAGHLHHPVFQIIASVAEQEDVQTFVIGGFVRDLLLTGIRYTGQRISISWCWEVGLIWQKRSEQSIEEEIPLTVFKNFGTAMLKWDDTEMEFVGARKESYRRDSRKPHGGEWNPGR